MATNHRRASRRSNGGLATDVRRVAVTKGDDSLNHVVRDEFVQATTEIRQQLEIQFRRIAQMQADIDLIKRKLVK